jgi:hypothetical protein
VPRARRSLARCAASAKPGSRLVTISK